MHCYTYPGQVITVVAQTYQQLEDVFLPEWRRQIPFEKYEYNGAVHNIKIPECDALIMLRYAEHPKAHERIRGATISGWYMIQGESIRQTDMVDTLNQRIRLFDTDENALRLIDCNPGNPEHWVYKRFIDQTSDAYIGEDQVKRVHVETTPETSKYSQATIDEWERTLSPVQFNRMIKGEWCASEGLVYDDYEILDHNPEPHEIRRYWIGMDPGTATGGLDRKGNLALVWIGELTNGAFCVFSEQILVFNGIEKLYNIILGVNESFGSGKFQALIKDWAGGSGAVFARELPNYGLSPILSPSGNRSRWFPVEAGITFLYEAFKTRKLTIAPGCVNLRQDLTSYVRDKDDNPDKKAYDPHLLDALRYGWIRVGRFYVSH